jgi:hypothetical protein
MKQLREGRLEAERMRMHQPNRPQVDKLAPLINKER